MIYLEEKHFARQLDLLGYLQSDFDSEIVFWLYPESNIATLLGRDLYNSEGIYAEPVTTYDESTIPRCTSRLLFDEDLLFSIKRHQQVISKHCDSICLYEKNSKQWTACTIGHEGMILLRNDELLECLRASGFNASIEAPDGW